MIQTDNQQSSLRPVQSGLCASQPVSRKPTRSRSLQSHGMLQVWTHEQPRMSTKSISGRRKPIRMLLWNGVFDHWGFRVLIETAFQDFQNFLINWIFLNHLRVLNAILNTTGTPGLRVRELHVENRCSTINSKMSRIISFGMNVYVYVGRSLVR